MSASYLEKLNESCCLYKYTHTVYNITVNLRQKPRFY